jgi:hypothetical protein
LPKPRQAGRFAAAGPSRRRARRPGPRQGSFPEALRRLPRGAVVGCPLLLGREARALGRALRVRVLPRQKRRGVEDVEPHVRGALAQLALARLLLLLNLFEDTVAQPARVNRIEAISPEVKVTEAKR